MYTMNLDASRAEVEYRQNTLRRSWGRSRRVLTGSGAAATSRPHWWSRNGVLTLHLHHG